MHRGSFAGVVGHRSQGRRARAPRIRVAVALVAACLSVVGGSLATASTDAPPRPRAVLFGDSLAVEVGPVWQFLLGADVETEVWAFGGTAPCDWFSKIEELVEHRRPDVVVFSFLGQGLTPCMRGPRGELTPTEIGAKYRRHAARATEIAQRYGAKVAWSAGPMPLAPPVWQPAVIAAYREVASTHPDTSYVDGNALFGPHGGYVHEAPCLPFERCDGPAGRNIVHSPDGTHFCPAPVPLDLFDGRCRLYSSGALRYAIELANPVVSALAG